MKTTIHHHRTLRQPRGVVLITALWIAVALAAVVLVLCREMIVESMTVKQHLAQAKTDAAELGAEQFVLSIIEQEMVSPGYKDNTNWQQRQIGECYFWVLTPNLDDETQPAYGLTDEAGKLDINYATLDMLEMLPGLDTNPAMACAIIDWRSPGEIVTMDPVTGAQGAKSDYYEANLGYHAKLSYFESLDELRLVAGLTTQPIDQPNADLVLYGADANHNAIIEPNEAAAANTGMTFLTTMRGIMPYITVWGYQATNPLGTSVTTTTTNATTGAPSTSTVTTNPLTTTTVASSTSGTTTTTTTTITATNTATTTGQTTTGNATIAANVTTLADAETDVLAGIAISAVPTTLSDVCNLVPVDVNTQKEQTILQQLLQEAVPGKATAAMTATRARVPAATTGRGPATTAKPFKNIWDWIIATGLDSTDLSSTLTPDGEPLFCVLTCIPPVVTNTIDTTTGTNPTTGALPTQAQFAQLNINTASIQALMCLPGTPTTTAGTAATAGTTTGTSTWQPAFTQDDAQNIITYRETNLIGQDPAQVPNISWLLDVVSDPTQLVACGNWITGWSTVYSADIVTVSKDGRAFKRVKIVVDDSSGTPVIVYRRDMTDAGWPLDPAIRTALRKGLSPDGAASSGDAGGTGGHLTFGAK